MTHFKLQSKFKPCGDQPQAIQALSDNIVNNENYQTLLGVTGSGKTFTLANAIEKVNKPTLVISHNKTLAAQLYGEFKEFFPQNAVEYFVSYYDYYQPEAYIPTTDTYIEKDASINDRLDRLRLSATSNLISRRDVIIVASVSCIYNLGSPEDYQDLTLLLEVGKQVDRDELLSRLVQLQYERNDYEFTRGRFRVRGEIVEVFPAYSTTAIRVEFDADTITGIRELEPVSFDSLNKPQKYILYPAKHFVMGEDKRNRAIESIGVELEQHLSVLNKNNKLLEAQRLKSRTLYDLAMLREIGYCHGIENYSRHFSGRAPGLRPYCLLDYFPEGFLTIIDESHVTVPQLRGMYEGDKARKQVLVEHGFRLPSCLDNRPLKFTELDGLLGQIVFVSATPAEFEINKSRNNIIQQIIRPTGLLDPEILIKPTNGQIDDLIIEINRRAQRNERILVTTLTKRMAEDLASFLQEKGLKVKYLHSEIDTIQRAKLLRELRRKDYDCLIGINLLREGLDLPEVSLIAILDADKEGFLRSARSLIQVAGRAARNINGTVFMYADRISDSMQKAMNESTRRRQIQLEFNEVNKITPRTIQKAIRDGIADLEAADNFVQNLTGLNKDDYELNKYISELEYEMELAARNLEFEKAAKIRDKIKEIKN